MIPKKTVTFENCTIKIKLGIQMIQNKIKDLQCSLTHPDTKEAKEKQEALSSDSSSSSSHPTARASTSSSSSSSIHGLPLEARKEYGAPSQTTSHGVSSTHKHTSSLALIDNVIKAIRKEASAQSDREASEVKKDHEEITLSATLLAPPCDRVTQEILNIMKKELSKRQSASARSSSSAGPIATMDPHIRRVRLAQMAAKKAAISAPSSSSSSSSS